MWLRRGELPLLAAGITHRRQSTQPPQHMKAKFEGLGGGGTAVQHTSCGAALVPAYL
jgi:hypothetical protein